MKKIETRDFQGIKAQQEDLGKEDMGKEDLGKEDMGSVDLGTEDLGMEDLGKEDIGTEDMGKEDMGKEDMIMTPNGGMVRYTMHMDNDLITQASRECLEILTL